MEALFQNVRINDSTTIAKSGINLKIQYLFKILQARPAERFTIGTEKAQMGRRQGYGERTEQAFTMRGFEHRLACGRNAARRVGLRMSRTRNARVRVFVNIRLNNQHRAVF
jgi:hypothetical protein